MLPFVSVIIPVLNGEQIIKECLASLLRMDYPPYRREILVVDNGSTDRTAEIVKTYPVRYLYEDRRGASHARNRGIEASKGAILAFTDADCLVTTRWLRELVHGFDEDVVGGVEGEIVAYPSLTPIEQYHARIGSHSRPIRLASPLFPMVPAGNVAFRREVFDRIGLFDARLVACEDIDYTWRFTEGTRLHLRYNSKAVVFHRHDSTIRGFFLKYMKYGRGYANLRAKYPAKLPWGWRKEARAWCAVAELAWKATRAVVRYGLRVGTKLDVYDAYLTFLRKLFVRLGFLRESLGGSRR